MRGEELEQVGAGELERAPARDAREPPNGVQQTHVHRTDEVEADRSPGVQRRRAARACRGVGLADLGQHQAAGHLAGEVDDDGIAVGKAAVERGGDGGRRVDDDEIAGSQEPAQRRRSARHRSGVAHAHQQTYVVTPPAARLRRFVGFVGGVEHEVEAAGRSRVMAASMPGADARAS